MKILLWLLPIVLSRAAFGGQTNEGVLSAVAVLTIHVSDTNIHDTVFRLLTNVFKLPVEYGPESIGQRRYAAVYAGNMFIEPCGPYTNMKYPTKDFKALFFGLNCVSTQRADAVAARLAELNFSCEKPGETEFRILDSSVAEGIYLAIDTKAPDHRAQEQETAFRAALQTAQRDALGFERVKVIYLGYQNAGDLQAWEHLLGPAGKVDENGWRLDRNQTIRFVKREKPGVTGIECKVRSLPAALEYLNQVKCPARAVAGKIELDRAETCGLAITLSDE